MSDTQSLNIAVVGGGPGGYAAAFLAADLGMTVTLIDPEVNPGGVCLYRGCIPSKALLHVAKLLEESHQAKDWGIEFAAPKIDLARLRSWKEGVVKKLTGGLGILSKQRILELYLNVIEWGHGIYGAEAAAVYYYRIPAARVDRDQAARLDAVIPAPLKRRPDRMDWYSEEILRRMRNVGW